jgi:hypothetical protein
VPDDNDNLALVLQNIALSSQDEEIGEEAVLTLLETRIREMLASEMDLLLSTLYRLDISEKKILLVLKGGIEGPAKGLARLVLERQKEKLKTRREYGGSKSDPFADL